MPALLFSPPLIADKTVLAAPTFGIDAGGRGPRTRLDGWR